MTLDIASVLCASLFLICKMGLIAMSGLLWGGNVPVLLKWLGCLAHSECSGKSELWWWLSSILNCPPQTHTFSELSFTLHSDWTLSYSHMGIYSIPCSCIPSCLFFIFWILYIFLYSRFLVVIHFKHIGVYMSIPVSQFIPPPPPPPPPLSPLGVHTFVLYICVSISALQTRSSVPFF